MDANQQQRMDEKERLLARLAELETEELREEGHFDETPHMSVLELAGHRLGQRLGRQVLSRAVGESAAQSQTANCPQCGTSCELEHVPREVDGLDGPTRVIESRGNCKSCRRSFFPSTRSDGIGQPQADA